ncbi:hypothetical protein JL721_229 [Aureococcus anophagefferens]|nr:hypothetical protein JL721_229 [Aureococcus anophagefferens]
MGEAPAPAPPASTPLAAREKPSLRRWLATHKLQACALCFMVMSIALYFLVQAFAAGGALGAALAVGFFCLFCYCCDQGYRIYASEGFWRTYAFYKALGPLVAEWKLLEKRAKLEKWSDDRARKAYDAFHVKAAPKIYDACISLGGIFIKMGQIAGSTFSFLLAQPYVVALEPLQDATPPRSYEAVAAIILDDTGKTVDDLFEDFAREPVGSASIAQAHKATLSEAFATSVAGECPWLAAGADRTVVVKIQYPEIARLYRVDFENIVYIAELVAKQDALDAIYDLQERHLEELDFTREAWNLKTVGANMAKAGFAPSRVVVPQPVPGLVSPCVLAMQYLEGPSLKNVINEHLEERAKFYGFDDVLKMKMFVQKQAKQDRDDALYRREHGGEEPPEEVELGLEEDTLGDVETGGGPNLEKLRVNLYRERAPRLTNAVARVGVAMGRLDRDTWLPDAGAADKAAPLVPPDVRLEELVDTLVEVHGHQLLSDGLVNLDPHPGNVLVLDGGRLGLIDYGQVRAFEPEERRSIATIVHALYRGDKAAVFAALEAMPPAGFQCQHQKHFPENVFRNATQSFDQFVNLPISHDEAALAGWHRPKDFKLHEMPEAAFLRTPELSVPPCMSSARRVTGILCGVGLLTMRVISLAQQWQGIAARVLADEFGAAPPRKPPPGEETKES